MIKIKLNEIVMEEGTRKYKFIYEDAGETHQFSIAKDYFGAFSNGEFCRITDNFIQYIQNVIYNITHSSGLNDKEWYLVNNENDLMIASNAFEKIDRLVEEELKNIRENKEIPCIILVSQIANLIPLEWKCRYVTVYIKRIIEEKMNSLVSKGELNVRNTSAGKTICGVYEVI